MLAEFPVVIFDEPGEHLDTTTADAITEEVVEVTRGRTTLIITHRLAGLDAMDEVVVLDAGRVVERGTHAELAEGGGLYQRMWQREQGLDLQGGTVPA
jgi:ABC-type multidrug transport system fused ATPase/permease subunit